MNISKWYLSSIFIIIFSALPSVTAFAQTDPDKTLSPYFQVQGDPNVDKLPLKDTTVDVAISGVIADVRVRQTYRNEGSRAINATYVFPASTHAAVYGMQMRIRDEIITARIKEREAGTFGLRTAHTNYTPSPTPHNSSTRAEASFGGGATLRLFRFA